MDKRISELMDAASEDVSMQDAALFDAERITSCVEEKLHAREKTLRPHRRIWRTVLIAAVIVSVLTAMAIAAAAGDARRILPGLSQIIGKTEVYTPGEGEIFIETGTGKNEGWSAARDDVAMILRYDVPKETQVVVCKANFLPDEPTWICPLSLLAQSRDSYEQELIAGLRASGMPPEEAWSEWNTGYFYHSSEGGIQWELQLFSGATLYRRDMTLGQYGGEATLEREWTDGDYACMEITLDYGACRNEKLAARGVYHHLLMFSEKDGYLLDFCGMESFEVLEKIAENLEVCVTPLTVTAEEPQDGVWSYTLLDAGVG